MGLLDGLKENVANEQKAKNEYTMGFEHNMTESDARQCVEKIVEVSKLKEIISKLRVEHSLGMLKKYYYSVHFKAEVYINDGSNKIDGWLSQKHGISYNNRSGLTLYVSDIRQIVTIFNELISYFKENKIKTYKEKPIIRKEYYDSFSFKDRAFIKKYFEIESFGYLQNVTFDIEGRIDCDKNGNIK